VGHSQGKDSNVAHG